MHFSKKYRILTNSTYDSKIRKLKISITKPAKKVGEHNMVMMITLKDKNENKLGVVLANVENMSVAEIIEIQKMVELRRTEWPDVPQDEIITMVERAMLDKGIQLVEYTNYIIEY